MKSSTSFLQKFLLIGIIHSLTWTPALSFGKDALAIPAPVPADEVLSGVQMKMPDTDVVAFDVSSEKELAQAEAVIRKQITETKMGPQSAQPQALIAAENQTEEKELSQIVADISPDAQLRKKNIDYLIEHNKAHAAERQNLKLVFIRFGLNTVAATWSLIASRHLNFGSALLIGGITGAISAGIQYWHDPFYKWVQKNYLAEKFNIKSEKGTWIANKTDYLWRWYITEFAFDTAIQMAIHGVAPGLESASFWGQAWEVNKAAVLAMSSQGLSDMGVDHNYAVDMKSPNFDMVKSVKRKQIGYMIGSVASVGLAVAQLVHAPDIVWGFVGLGATGIINYWFGSLRQKKMEKSCRGLLSRPEYEFQSIPQKSNAA